mmetsp:Transcript_717/g.2158  ORF Transcript_717/g.2158 Transcript_717/m.2158 type:complete len:259 (-) Transcript_717:17-793(-)
MPSRQRLSPTSSRARRSRTCALSAPSSPSSGSGWRAPSRRTRSACPSGRRSARPSSLGPSTSGRGPSCRAGTRGTARGGTARGRRSCPTAHRARPPSGRRSARSSASSPRRSGSGCRRRPSAYCGCSVLRCSSPWWRSWPKCGCPASATSAAGSPPPGRAWSITSPRLWTATSRVTRTRRCGPSPSSGQQRRTGSTTWRSGLGGSAYGGSDSREPARWTGGRGLLRGGAGLREGRDDSRLFSAGGSDFFVESVIYLLR